MTIKEDKQINQLSSTEICDYSMLGSTPLTITTSENNNTPVDTTNTNTKTKTAPNGFHNPPFGCIDIANKHLWDHATPQSPPTLSFGKHKSYERLQDKIIGSSSGASSVSSITQGEANHKHVNFNWGRRKGVKLNLRSPSTTRDVPYSCLAYMTPPTSPISGRRNIAPLGLHEFDYHETLDTTLRRPLEWVRYCSSSIGMSIKSFFVSNKLSKLAILIIFTTVSLGIVLLSFNESVHAREHQITRQIVTQHASLEERLRTPGSPQYKALQWIASEDPMQLSPYDENMIMRYVMAVMYYSIITIDGMIRYDYNIWLSSDSVCQWEGIICSLESPSKIKVVGLNLTNVQGQLPGKELSVLNQLQWLHLGQSNQISGTLPSEIGFLTDLVILSLGDNQMSGAIPSEITALTSLELLSLHNNNFNASIPTGIGNLSNLAVIYLDNNHISGHIPASLSQLYNLVDLRLNNNLIEGSIPSEIGLLTQLHKLYLDTNKLTGPLPDELSNIKDLKQLHIQRNDIKGQVSSSICNLSIHHHITFKVDCDKLYCSCCFECGHMNKEA